MSKRGDAGKLTKITVLMVLGMLLLAGFLGYWLNAQYRSAEVTLEKDLTRIFSRSVNDVTDSFITDKFIRPLIETEEDLIQFKVGRDSMRAYILKDTSMEKDLLEIVRDTVLKKDRVYRSVFKTRGQIQVRGNGSPTELVDTALLSGVDQMRKGIEILIREMRHAPAGNMKINKVAIEETFAHRLKKDGLPFSFGWPDSSRKSGIKVSELYAGTQLSMVVYDYKGHIFKAILAEILFAILLLSIIATAFVSMYRSYRSQERLSMMKNDLVSNMTHELRTPIATVKVALEALDSFQVINDPKTSREYLQMAVSEMDRLELLVNQALNTSLLEAGNMSLQKESQDVLSVVSQAIKAMQPKLVHSQAVVSLVADKAHYPAYIDKLHIQGVLINLLDNSIKYADKAPVIGVAVIDNGSNITISVKDNGPGIPQRYLDKVFDKFFRVPTGLVHNTRGYGLGLSYARQVVEQHGGSISVVNNEGGGCTFSVTVPKAVS